MAKKRNGQYTEQVMVRLTTEDRANVRAEAKAEDRSEAWVIREAVRARYRQQRVDEAMTEMHRIAGEHGVDL